MRGHWESQTRKLNRHYQSVSGGGDKTWDGTECLIPDDCIFAPYYGVFHNGQPLFFTDVTGLSFSQSIDPNIEIAKIDVDVRPYIPRITDDYYGWDEEMYPDPQQPLQWIADDEEGCVVRFYYNYGALVFHTDIMTIPGGTDFSTQMFDLIKPEYDFYVVRGLSANVGNSYNLKAVYDSISTGKIKYDIRAHKSNLGDERFGYSHGLYGSFGNSTDDYYWYTSAIMSYFTPRSFLIDPAYRTKFVTGGTPPTSPFSQTYWSGPQYPSIWYTGAVNSSAIPMSDGLLPGFKYTEGTVNYWANNMFPFDNYKYTTLWVLKRLTKIRSTIMG